MDKSPTRRIQSASEAQALLADYHAHLHNPTVVRKPRPPVKSHTNRKLLWSLLGMLLAVSSATLCLKYQVWNSPGSRPGKFTSRDAPYVPASPPIRSSQNYGNIYSMAGEDEFRQALDQLEHEIGAMESQHIPPNSTREDGLSSSIKSFDVDLRKIESK